MRAFLAILLSLALVVAGMDAALHTAALLDAGAPHEVHGLVHAPGEIAADVGVPDSPVPDEPAPDHFCHCAAHSPALLTAFHVALLPGLQTVVAGVLTTRAEGVFLPPLRPPKMA